MAITNGYTTLAQVKLRLGRTDTDDDTALEAVIESASRQIDALCDRKFWSETATRYYTAEFSDLLYVDDIQSVTTLGTDNDGDRTYEVSWASTDYDLEPYNNALTGIAAPYTSLRITPAGRYGFPTGQRRGVKIVGTFGWSAVPLGITEATIIQATRLFHRKDSPYGVAGVGDFGRISLLPRVDPDVNALCLPFMRLSIGAI